AYPALVEDDIYACVAYTDSPPLEEPEPEPELPPEERTLHAIVHGRVQGVGFRFFVNACADALNLRGWVRNLPDGTVEVHATGTRCSLANLRADLGQGPVGAVVESVQASWQGEPVTEPGFRVMG